MISLLQALRRNTRRAKPLRWLFSDRGILSPLLATMLFILFLMMALIIDAFMDTVTRSRARAAANAIALHLVQNLQPPEYGPANAPVKTEAQLLQDARALAWANGAGTQLFNQVMATNLVFGDTWAEATLDALDCEVEDITKISAGVPAGEIALGGTMPLAIYQGILPDNNSVVTLTFAGFLNARLVTFGVFSPESVIASLNPPGSGPNPPPKVALGDTLNLPPPNVAANLISITNTLTSINATLLNRPVIVPIIAGINISSGTVVDFRRIVIESVNIPTRQMTVRLAPSAVSAFARAGANPPPVANSITNIPPLGRVLRPVTISSF